MVLPHFPPSHISFLKKNLKKKKKKPLPSSKLSHTHPIPGPKIKKTKNPSKEPLMPSLAFSPLVTKFSQILEHNNLLP